MKVIIVKDIVRKDIPIYYRQLYTGVATIELTKNTADYRVDFCIETKPTGKREISLSFLDEVDYPLIPVIKELKKIIETMDENGALPD